MHTEELVVLDPRGRVSLGKVTAARDRQYVAHELPGGVIVMTPAVVFTREQVAILEDPRAMAAITRSRVDRSRRRRLDPPEGMERPSV